MRSNAAKVVLRLKREDNLLTKHRAALYESRILEQHMLFRIEARKFALAEYFLVLCMIGLRVMLFRGLFTVLAEAYRRVVYDGLHLLKGNGAGVEIETSANNLPALSVLALVRSCHGTFYRLNHGPSADTALLELSEHSMYGF